MEGINIQDLRFSKSIELRGGTDCVSAHVFPIEPVADIQQRKTCFFGETIDRVAGGSPNAAFELGIVICCVSIVELTITGENLWIDLLMIKENAVE